MDISTKKKLSYSYERDEISLTGRIRIKKKLDDVYGLTLPWNWSWAWNIKKRKEGSRDVIGTLPKRISRWAWNSYRCRISKEHVSEIGNVGSTYRSNRSGFGFSFTDTIDWNAGDFGDSGSCFWSCHKSAKDIIIDHGGGAIKFYETSDGVTNWLKGIARVWFLPYGDCGDFMVFNGYGYTTLEISQAVSSCLNYNYESICLSNFNDSNGVLWINNGAAYLIGPSIEMKDYEEDREKLRSVNLELEDIRYRCRNCNSSSISNDSFTPAHADSTSPRSGHFCKKCMIRYYAKCKECKTVFARGIEPRVGFLCCECKGKKKRVDSLMPIEDFFLSRVWDDFS